MLNFFPQNWTKFLEQLTIACDSIILVEFHDSMSRIDPCFLLSIEQKTRQSEKLKIYKKYFASFSADSEAYQYSKISRKLTVDIKFEI